MQPCADYDYFEPTPWGFGSTHQVTYDEQEKDVVEQLHDVVKEVTGKSFHKPKIKFGFV